MPSLPIRLAACATFIAGLLPSPACAWDYAGHRIVNQLALASLPREYPQFVHAVAHAERVAFLSCEPDRWRNVPDLPLTHFNGLDHYCDMESIPLAGLDWDRVPSFRYDFVAQFAAGRKANERNFPVIDPARNVDHSREWPGFAPWAITEYYGKLRSAFSYLKVYQELGTPGEIMDARANILYVMGVMGHFVGDLAQPLHTTKHFNGWSGDNPKGYTTWRGLHAWVDGGMIAKAGIKTSQLASRTVPVKPIPLVRREDGRDPMFVAVFEYLRAQHRLVEPLYQLEKTGQLGHGSQRMSAEARAFIERRLIEGGQMLGAIWLSAYRSAGADSYLRSALIKRQTGSGVNPRTKNGK
jgi:hypothetical protein